MGLATDNFLKQSFAFGEWLLQGDGVLLRNGKVVHLPPKELQVLRLLLDCAGRLVTKDHLLDRVWAGSDAAEESLTRCIYALRKLLGAERGYIATVYGKGYRFTGVVAALVSPPVEAPTGPSLAVMPFRQADERLSSSLQEATIRQLKTAFDGTLRILPAALTMAGAGAIDTRQLMERLAPDYYLSGRLQACGDQLELSVELIRGHGHHLVYGPMTVKGTSEEVLGSMVSMVARHLPQVRPAADGCSSYPVALAFLQGMHGLQRHTVQSVREALLYFRQCLQMDASYVPPWWGVADAYLALSLLGAIDQQSAIGNARDALARALELEPGNREALARLALVTSLQGCDDAAQVLFQRCLAGSERADIHYLQGWHYWAGGHDERALACLEAALRQDPGAIAAQLMRIRIVFARDPWAALAMTRDVLEAQADEHPLLGDQYAVIQAHCAQLVSPPGISAGRQPD
ncbi:winged helix-turn-helix domain-containing protein [Pseudomonas vanderleydeniana]|uniref:Winged helix-turn-helix domain-containing protein n=1 Tax=Pseudomonas vanderleydeniana TaxID=2745495 RepID=A0A9E6PIH0_9PSED|nr:winged helix-turn-helix domain-containing protein [Pseudomonas vanderleydeniana]QXI27099.1 winged helix-turn-helix domain-containing protein [Pseudomonas vanderleydeniana]